MQKWEAKLDYFALQLLSNVEFSSVLCKFAVQPTFFVKVVRH